MNSSLRRIHARQGSLCLEAALTLPLVLVLTAQMISLMMMARAEIVLEGALDRTAAELSLLSPLCEKLAEWQSGEISSEKQDGSLPDIEAVGPEAGILSDALSDLWPDQDLAAVLRDAALDFTSSALLGEFIQYRLDVWLKESMDGQKFRPSRIRERRIFLDWKLNERSLWLCLSWAYRTPMGDMKRMATAVVPLWIGKDSRISPGKTDDVWLMDNFSRGKYFRQKFGANLPYDFPVIAAMNQTEVLSIKSIDLTAPTYQSPEELKDALLSHIDALAGFSQAHYERRGCRIDIDPAMISSRRLLLIIPENTGQDWLEDFFAGMQTLAEQKGVQLQITRYGSSSRFRQDELVS